MLNAFFILKIFNFLIFDFKIYDVTEQTTNNYNTDIV